mgnify:FL=1
MKKKYQVFISATFQDLQKERTSAIEAVLMAKQLPVAMEAFVASSDEQFDYIKDCIDGSDYYILILGGCYGSINPSTGKSYTEMEFDYALEKKIPILAFLYNDITKLKHKDKDLTLITNFRNKVTKDRLCKFFTKKGNLKGDILAALLQEIERNPQIGWVKADTLHRHINPVLEKQKTDLQSIISEGQKLLAEAENHYTQTIATGGLSGPFNGDYNFKIWQNRIREYIKQNDFDKKYFNDFKNNEPYNFVIKEQIVKLYQLLASIEYSNKI